MLGGEFQEEALRWERVWQIQGTEKREMRLVHREQGRARGGGQILRPQGSRSTLAPSLINVGVACTGEQCEGLHF